MAPALQILGEMIAQMGLLLLRERVVREVFASTARALAKKAGPGLLQDNLNTAARAWEPPKLCPSKVETEQPK